jgi:hypothetical protein
MNLGNTFVVPDRISPSVSGYFRIPAIWVGEKPLEAEVRRLNPRVHHKTVFRSKLRCGIAVRVQRDGLFVFDFADWPYAPPVVIPGFTSQNGKPVPRKHHEAERKAAAFIVLRSKLMNVHQACFTTAEVLEFGRGAMMVFLFIREKCIRTSPSKLQRAMLTT